MEPRDLHPWKVPVDQARGIQQEFAEKIDLENRTLDVSTIAGADIALGADGRGYAAVIVYSFPGLEPVEVATAEGRLTFPYVPGLLSFREGPLLIKALSRVRREPDVLFFDGQGVAHPRRLGIASHLGLVFDKPSIGCAKTRLTGTFKEPGPAEGDFSPLTVNGRFAGYALRSRPKAKPLFVSPGHKLDYETARKLTLVCVDGPRVPKPTRQADALAKAFKQGQVKEFIKKLK